MTTMVAMVGMVKVAGIGRRVYDEVKRHKVMTTSEVSVVEGMERWRGEWRNGGVRVEIRSRGGDDGKVWDDREK